MFHAPWRRWLVLLSSAVISSGGCGGPAPDSDSTGQPKQYAIGVSLASLNGPWRTHMKAEIEAAAARHPNVRLIVLDARDDVARQLAQLEELRSQRVDAVIVSPRSSQSITSPVARMYESGVPAIILDRPLIGGKYTCFIAADPAQIGAAAGQWLAERLHGKGKIVELLAPADSWWAQRLHAAWRAELQAPGYRFVFSEHVDPPNYTAATLMRDALERNEQIDAVFAYDDAAAHAAYQVAKAAHRQQGVLFIGIGGLPSEGAAYVKEGILSVSFLDPIGGDEAVEAALRALHGERLPKKIMSPTMAITKESLR